VRPRVYYLLPLAGSVFLGGCKTFVGYQAVIPEKNIVVVDTEGKPLTDYDLYVYRCTDPGSRCDRVFSFPSRTNSELYLSRKIEKVVKRRGGVWLSDHVYWSYEPEPYWVAAVNKRGYKSRRWSLSETQGDPVKIVLEKSVDPGPDYCDGTTVGDCNPCRSFEYFFYEVSRYRHSNCK